jgi:hypothetical protein
MKTLEQLIEECGDDFRWLKARGHNETRVWLAQGRPHPINSKDIHAIGRTPIEAVYLLLEKLAQSPRDN